MAHRLSLLGSFFLLALAGNFLNGSAIDLGARSTTTRTTTTTTTTPNPQTTEIDEPFTTKRNVKLHVVGPHQDTRFPFQEAMDNEGVSWDLDRQPVENAEVESTQAALGTVTARAAVRGTTAAPAKGTTATTPPSRQGSVEQPLYRLNGANGRACILLQVDALITVKYKTKLGEQQEANIYVPDNALVTGNCEEENNVIMSLKWDSFVLSWSFAKTPGGERWYVEKIELTYNSSDKHFEHIDEPNRTVRVSTAQKHTLMMFPTPVGKSYSCNDEQVIEFTDGKHSASIILRQMKLQPFKFKNNDFAMEFSCTALSARAGRDETAPVAVGSTLAAVVLLTIAGYAGWRYFKVKKVKYDTME